MTTSPDLQTQLAVAAHCGYLSACKALVDQGADVNFADKDQFTPLMEAAQGGNPDVCRFLIEQGAKLDAKDRDQMTPLHHAARENHPQAAAALIDAGAPLEAPGHEGRTPLFQAALYGSSDALGVLIEKGADIEATNSFRLDIPFRTARTSGRSPLHAATREGEGDFRTANYPNHLACAKLLIGAGANVDAREHLRIDVQVAATQSRYTHELTPLNHVQTPAMAHLLIDSGANAAGTDSWQTPFRSAVEGRHRDVAATLVNAGYEPSEKDWQAFDEAKLETQGAFEDRCGRLKAERLEKRLAASFYLPEAMPEATVKRSVDWGQDQSAGMRVRF